MAELVLCGMSTYFPPSLVDSFIDELKPYPIFKITQVGASCNELPINLIQFGKGEYRVLIWSQMHGNEPTTTWALKFLLEWVLKMISSKRSNNMNFEYMLEHIQVSIIMQLNPDGALLHKRENSSGVDLNRDAQNLTQPESVVLSKLHEDIQPHLCLNLHDQRPIYAAGLGGEPTAIAFLAPSAGENQKSINSARVKAMHYILLMINNALDSFSNQIALYSDSFNPHCVGDKFITLNTPTILVEAGFIPGDYSRKKVANLVYSSLKYFLLEVTKSTFFIRSKVLVSYLELPKNSIEFSDILLQNVWIQSNGKVEYHKKLFVDLKEKLLDDKIKYVPIISKQYHHAQVKAHFELNCSDQKKFKTIEVDNHTEIQNEYLNQIIESYLTV